MTDEEKRERSGRRLRASHLCADPGPAIAEPDWKPRAVKANPEEIMRAAFQGRSYAPVPPLRAESAKALDELHSALQGAD
jgi:hypothetical protein